VNEVRQVLSTGLSISASYPYVVRGATFLLSDADTRKKPMPRPNVVRCGAMFSHRHDKAAMVAPARLNGGGHTPP
jgi:hypothetical protein